MSRSLRLAVAAVAALIVQAAVTRVYNFSSILPYTALDFFTVPFAVPSGTAELQVDHLQTAFGTTNILDWGLADPVGRVVGWGGGNTESAIVGVLATSRSYNLLPTSVADGFLVPGNWSVIVGKPRIATPPGSYSINVTLRDAPTLPPQPERQPYVPCPPLRTPPAGQALEWYAGDFHVHSRESGDAFANATADEIALFARSQGLDFVHFSEHNTVSTASFLVDAQSRHADILLLPGVEFTTYHGHSGAMFTSEFVDFRIGLPGVTIQAAADAIHGQDGLMSINHIDSYTGDSNGDLRNACVGCTWDFGGALGSASLDAMEIAIQSWSGIGFELSPQAIEYWDHQHALGFTNIAPIGGSDDHHGGQEEERVGNWEVGSPIGSPTTMVLAANLSHAAVREGVALGRVVVKMFNDLDPMVDLTAALATAEAGGADHLQAHARQSAALRQRSHAGRKQRDSAPAADEPTRVGGTLRAPSTNSRVTLTATVSVPAAAADARTSNDRRLTGAGFYLALVRNNEQTFVANITGSPFSFNVTVPVPIAGVDRWRAEVHDAGDGTMHTISNHIFLPAIGA